MRFLGIFIIVVFTLAFYLKSWQCAEMFPSADRLACILW